MKGEKRGNVTKGYQKLRKFRYVSCLAVAVRFESQDDPLVSCIFGSKGLFLYAHIFFVRIPDKSSIEKKILKSVARWPLSFPLFSLSQVFRIVFAISRRPDDIIILMRVITDYACRYCIPLRVRKKDVDLMTKCGKKVFL